MKSVFILLFLIHAALILRAQQQDTLKIIPLPDKVRIAGGTVQRYENFPSRYVTPRNVDVWLPPGYRPSDSSDVLYMHDGQMLFDSSVTWNQQAWDVDDVIMALLHESRIRQVIVVGIWNGGETRHSDYFPMKPFGLLTGSQQDAVMAAARPNGVSLFKGEAINSDNYLRFLVTELKPFIDRTYSVNSGMEHTFVAGSSMGGLISLYAICEYPEVFGGAACMSTHWPGIFTMEGNPVPDAFFSYMSQHLPDPQTHSIYFDCGDQTLDALYPPLQAKADAVMREKGFTGKSWQTRFFPGKDHSEKSWNERLHIPLTFLLGKE